MTGPTTNLATLSDCPPELIDVILENIPGEALQRTALSLMQVFPDVPISKTHLYRHLRVSRAQQLKPMWFRLQADKDENKGQMLASVKSFTMACWSGDADIMNNILRLIPDVAVLMISMGTNFMPEHLTELADVQRSGLKRLELRFRPYVDKASYYQFLKGSYFDTAIDTMIKRWEPSPSFTRLSLVQDIPPRFSVPDLVKLMERKKRLANRVQDLTLSSNDPSDTELADMEDLADDALEDATPVEPRGYTGHGPFPYLSSELAYVKPKTFAQPIVFFDIRCLYRLAISDAARYLTHLRIRIPCRDVARVLSEVPPGQDHARPFPALTYLDLSTTNLRHDGWLAPLLRLYPRLEHLVLDRTNLFGFAGKDNGAELCHELGKMCVMAGLSRGKDKEREIAAADLAARRQQALRELEARRRAPSHPSGHDSGEGSGGSDDEAEGGEATPAPTAVPDPVYRRAIGHPRRGHRSVAMASFSIRDRPLRASRANRTVDPELELPLCEILSFVLPALPTLRSISIGGENNSLDEVKARTWDVQFQEGWKEGLSKILEWAMRVIERYERAIKVADQWAKSEEEVMMRKHGKVGVVKHGKHKSTTAITAAAAANSKVKVKPPTTIRLYRYPSMNKDEQEEVEGMDITDTTFGLVQVETAKDWLDECHSAIAQVSAYLASFYPTTSSTCSGTVLEPDVINRPQAILCARPDCEGPWRRGDGGERSDGRVMPNGLKHRQGCGHEVGRAIWGRAES